MYAYLHSLPGSCKSHLFVRDFHPCTTSDLKHLWGGPSIFPPAEFIDSWGTPTPLSYPVLSGHWRWLRKGRKAEGSSWFHPLLPAAAVAVPLCTPLSVLSPGLAEHTLPQAFPPPTARLRAPFWNSSFRVSDSPARRSFLEYSVSRPHSSRFHSNALLNRKIWIQALL